MNKQRIALIVSGLSFGGAEGAVLRLHKALNDSKLFESHLFVFSGSNTDNYQSDKHNLHYVKTKTIVKYRKIRESIVVKRFESKILKFEKTHGKFDWFISNMNFANRICSLSRFDNVVYYLRNNLEKEAEAAKKPKRHKKLFHDILNEKYCMSISSTLADESLTSGYISPAKVETVTNVVDTETITRMSKEKPQMALPENYILHIGRLTSQKRHDLLIQAYLESDLTIPLVCITNKPEKLRSQIPLLDTKKQILVYGFQQNPYSIIKNSSLVVLSSDYEGLCNVMLESICLNKRFVSTACDFGPPEIMSGHLSDYLTPCDDASGLARRMEWALSQNEPEKSEVIMQQFDAENVVTALQKVLSIFRNHKE